MSVYHICRADSIFLLGKLRIPNPLFSGNKKGYCIAPVTDLIVKQKSRREHFTAKPSAGRFCGRSVKSLLIVQAKTNTTALGGICFGAIIDSELTRKRLLVTFFRREGVYNRTEKTNETFCGKEERRSKAMR